MKELLLTILRNKETSTREFRSAAQKLANLIAAEAAPFIPLRDKQVETPLAVTLGKTTAKSVVLIPILRAGLALLPSFLDVFPDAKVGIFGIRRDEQTARPELYYEKLPALDKNDLIFVLDPMLATGGSAGLAIERLLKAGASPDQIHLFGIIGARPGFEAISKIYPEVTLNLVTVDPSLDGHYFIVPGLGDFGDRYFGNVKKTLI